MITIVILLILAGVTISTLTGENGLLSRSKEASEKYTKAQVKEEIELAIADIKMQLAQTIASTVKVASTTEKDPNSLIKIASENEQFDMNAIIKYLPEKLLIDTDLLWTNKELEEPEGTYKGYNFKVKNDYSVEIIDKISDIDQEVNPTSDINTAITFDGSTYVNTSIQENEFIKTDGEFTIAVRTRICKNIQSTISYMGILGNHSYSNGIQCQFYETSSTLCIGTWVDNVMKVDYTPYFDKWTDIVITYSNNIESAYLDGELVGSITVETLTDYQNVLLGTSFLGADRCMKGQISSCKIWSKELTNEEITSLNMAKSNTTVQKNSILYEIALDSQENINQYGEIVGENYIFKSTNDELVYDLKFNHASYVNPEITQSTILENNAFTIATQVKINRTEQSGIAYMDLFGNHYNTTGVVAQFIETTSTLGIGISTGTVKFDYTEYYDKWINLVYTYNNGENSVYIDGTLIGSATGKITEYGNFYIGTGFLSSNRCMTGMMKSFKIWNTSLPEQQITQIDFNSTNSLNSEYKLYDQIYTLKNTPISGLTGSGTTYTLER